MKPKAEFSSLMTANAVAGLALANQIADQILVQLAEANDKVERPGGTTFLLPPAMPREVISSIMFYAITTANCGWPANS
jgi:hypothetical protein